MAQCFQGEQQKRLQRVIQAPAPESHQETIKLLNKHRDNRDWLAATTLCDQILLQQKHDGALLGDGAGSWRSLRSYVRDFIQKLPPEGLQFLRRRREMDAKRLWQDGRSESLQLLLSRYPLPEFQSRVRTRLFNEWAESGAFHDAFRIAQPQPDLLKSLPGQVAFGPLRKVVRISASVKSPVLKLAKRHKEACHGGSHLACFPGPKMSLVLRCELRDDPAFQGAEFGGLVLPKQRSYILEGWTGKSQTLSWRRPLCTLGGESKGTGGVFLASEQWIYGVLEHELMLCIERTTGELLWLRDLRPKGPPAIEIGGPELNRPDTRLSLGVRGVLRIDGTKKLAELVEPGSGRSLGSHTGSDDDLFFSALNGRVLRIDKGGQVWVDSRKLPPSRVPQLNWRTVRSIDMCGEALIMTGLRSLIIWFPEAGEQFQLAGDKPGIIDAVKRMTRSLRIRYRGKEYWQQYAAPKRQMTLSFPKGS